MFLLANEATAVEFVVMEFVVAVARFVFFAYG
jgi:hypothetical protein